MARIFVTGSTQGLGRAAAEELLSAGNQVVVHARDHERAAGVRDLLSRGARLVVGELADDHAVRALADQVNELGRMDVVIHNAGVYLVGERDPNRQGHPHTLAVNVLAPYLLTALIPAPRRLVYLTSGLYRGGDPSLADLDWRVRRWDPGQAYSDSKLYVTALALAVARRWPQCVSSAVDPGWVPTRMGGRAAPDSIADGTATQVWLASSSDPAALVSGQVWHHLRVRPQTPAVADPGFQDRLLAVLAEMTGESLP